LIGEQVNFFIVKGFWKKAVKDSLDYDRALFSVAKKM